MLPSEKRSGFPGNMETFLVTSKARWPAVVSRTSSVGGQGEGQVGNSEPGPILHQQQPQGLPAPRTQHPAHPLHLGLGLSSQKTSNYVGLLTYLLFAFGKASQSLWVFFPVCLSDC